VPKRDVAPVPSATTWAALLDSRAEPGRGSLDLAADRPRSALTEAIRDQEVRWRTAHLAVPLSLNPRRPVFSALAFAPEEGSRGALSVYEIYAMRIPADLVLLPRCRVTSSRPEKAEGVTAVVRGFMVAGSPRVLVNLWPVDERAERAFVAEFLRLFAPPEGGGALPAAEALRKAQEHVRSTEGWEHPHYWAAWQLWGLAN
jgi:CHAT domain-containing protein